MDKKYIELFRELAHATETSAEQVMDYEKGKGDDKSFNVAETLRNDFAILYDKIKADDFDGVLAKADYARLLVGCYVIVGNLQDRIQALQKAIAGYQVDVMPKLSKVVEAGTDEEAQAIAEEQFQIKEEKE